MNFPECKVLMYRTIHSASLGLLEKVVCSCDLLNIHKIRDPIDVWDNLFSLDTREIPWIRQKEICGVYSQIQVFQTLLL